MLPPPDEDVLQNNPDFANLYKILTTTVLNQDGSSKHDPAARERSAVKEQLDKYRLKAAKQHILEHAIANATPPEPKQTGGPKAIRAATERQRQQFADLPESLLDLILILPPLFEAEQAGELSPDSVDLLLSSPPLSNLEVQLPDLADLVSFTLHESALSIARLTHPSTNPSFLHRHVSSLPQDISALGATLSARQQSLVAARIRTLTALTGLVQCYTQSLAGLVRSLEAKHGAVSRSLELRAAEVSLQAQRAEADADQTMRTLRKDAYPPQVISALQNYAAHLRDAKFRGAERVRGLEAELGEYGVGISGKEHKEKTMREMARVYQDMGRQIEDVKRDLERLQRS